jgi:hypothetical protein
MQRFPGNARDQGRQLDARGHGQPGSVTFLRHFGGSINLNLHFHMIFLEGSTRTVAPKDSNHGFDVLYRFTPPWSDGTTGIKLSPLELLEKPAALVPLPRMHLLRYGGCLAPHSHLRAAIIPTPRQQGVEGPEGQGPSPDWTWARLLKRVFSIDMECCSV